MTPARRGLSFENMSPAQTSTGANVHQFKRSELISVKGLLLGVSLRYIDSLYVRISLKSGVHLNPPYTTISDLNHGCFVGL